MSLLFISAKTKKDFVTKVIRAITDNTEMIESQRSEFARSNTWEVRIDTLEKIYASKKLMTVFDSMLYASQ